MNRRRIGVGELAARLAWPARRRKWIARTLVTALAAAFEIAGAESVAILQNGDISAWTERRFKGNTSYETVTLEGRRALRASSNGTASGVFIKVRVNIEATPILHWSWRVEKALGPIDERTRGGDDYSARVYVLRRRPLRFWMTTALNYVWSSSIPKGTAWPNAYTSAVRMVSVRSGASETGQWIDEQRDVREDFLKLLGRRVRHIDGVALMTDTDDAGGTAVTYYGDIRFSSE